MQAFEVHLNGKKLCLAGVGDDGVLTAVVTWVGSKRGSDLFLHVGGLVSPSEEHVSWVRQRPLGVGDKIAVRVVKKKEVDEATIKYRLDPTKELKNEKIYVRKMAKKFGWTIQTSAKSKKTK
jgi:hypothetical protein